MRVVAGTARGRRFEAPTGTDTRPTNDRVREAVFNALTSAGALGEIVAVDLFAGSGALGIEAISRGALEVHFVEADRTAASVVSANLAALGMTEQGVVHVGSVDRLIARLPHDIDLVLADPPYAYDGWDGLFAALETHLADDAVAVCESDRPVEPPAGWEKLREKTYGGTVVTFARWAGITDPTGEDE